MARLKFASPDWTVQKSAVANAIAPDLSAIRPVESHPEWDVAIWLDILTMPDTPDANKFYSEMEKWILATMRATMRRFA